MVKDLLSLSDRYASLGSRFTRAFQYAKATDFTTMGVGTYPIGGDDVRALVQRYTTRPESEVRWEAHRKNIDLQFVLSGEEYVGVAPLGRMEAEPYDADKDLLWLSGEGDRVTLRPGEFMLLWPEDVHKPAVSIDTPVPVLKVVIKIAV